MGALSGAPGASGWLGPAGVFAVLALGALDLGLEQSIVLPALPMIAVEQQATPDAVTWLVTGYLTRPGGRSTALRSTGRPARAAAPGGRLTGRLRRGLADLALADSLAGLIAGRVMQGLGAAVAALGIGIIRDHLAPRALPVAVGVLVAGAGAGHAIGLVVGGVLVEPGLGRRDLLVPLRGRLGPASRRCRARATVGHPRRRPRQLAGSGCAGSGRGHPSARDLQGQRLGLVVGADGGASVARRRTARRVLRPRAAHRPSPGRTCASWPSARWPAPTLPPWPSASASSSPPSSSPAREPAAGYWIWARAQCDRDRPPPSARRPGDPGVWRPRRAPRGRPRGAGGRRHRRGVRNARLRGPGSWHDGVAEVAAANGLLGAGIGLSIAGITTLVVTSVEPSARVARSA